MQAPPLDLPALEPQSAKPRGRKPRPYFNGVVFRDALHGAQKSATTFAIDLERRAREANVPAKIRAKTIFRWGIGEFRPDPRLVPLIAELLSINGESLTKETGNEARALPPDPLRSRPRVRARAPKPARATRAVPKRNTPAMRSSEDAPRRRAKPARAASMLATVRASIEQLEQYSKDVLEENERLRAELGQASQSLSSATAENLALEQRLRSIREVLEPTPRMKSLGTHG